MLDQLNQAFSNPGQVESQPPKLTWSFCTVNIVLKGLQEINDKSYVLLSVLFFLLQQPYGIWWCWECPSSAFLLVSYCWEWESWPASMI